MGVRVMIDRMRRAGRTVVAVVGMAGMLALSPGTAPGLGDGAANAADASCKQLFKLKSKESKTKTSITFVNKAKTYRAVMWLGFDGHPKDYGNLAPGQQKTIQTFLTHPWMVATGPGDCLEIVLPRSGTAATRVIMKENGVEVAADGSGQAAGEEGGKATGCPPGTVPVPETDDCKAAPKGKEARGKPVDGRSLGGILRAKPQQDSARVTSLDEGQRITILRNTGVMWNDYPWFEIRAGGTTGYKWGGILCADVPMPGVYEVCKSGSAQNEPTKDRPQQGQATGGAPSWCGAAKLPAEHAICGNPELSKLDDVLNVAYKRATSDSPKMREEIDREHRRWRGRRDACGNDGGCLERRYREEISLLEGFFSN